MDAILNSVDHAVLVLVGNKADLTESRSVTSKQAREFAARRGMEFFETSTKEMRGIEEVMDYLVTHLMSRDARSAENSIVLSSSTTNHVEASAKRKGSTSNNATSNQTQSKCASC